MLKIGLTGGIGSGKSVVSGIFKTLGIPVLDSDSFTKDLMNNNEDLKYELIKNFGTEIYQNNKLNRTLLASKVFGFPEKLALLNSITHPVVRKFGAIWMEKQNAPYVLKEAALFFESGSNFDMDYMIGVSAPFELRLERAMQRDQVSKETILKRMASQMDEDEKMKLCDFIIINDGRHSLIHQVMNLHKKLLQLTNKQS